MSNSNKFEKAKDCFADAEGVRFINLDTSVLAFEKLAESVENSHIKMTLLSGLPGTGKSVLLEKIYERYKENMNILLVKIPFDSIESLLWQINNMFIFLADRDIDEMKSFTLMLDKIANGLNDKQIIILLDEAQIYAEKELEYIRLLSDTKKFKFILALHELKNETVIVREYFKSRIWQIIKLENLSRSEVHVYIEKKLLAYSLYDVIVLFSKTNYSLIYKLTHGNLRNINKLLFLVFNIVDYYSKHDGTKVDMAKIPNKIIEMAAIELGFING